MAPHEDAPAASLADPESGVAESVPGCCNMLVGQLVRFSEARLTAPETVWLNSETSLLVMRCGPFSRSRPLQLYIIVAEGDWTVNLDRQRLPRGPLRGAGEAFRRKPLL